MLCLGPPLPPTTEDPGLDCARDLNGVMLCETPLARVNCSRSSTFVRPLAGRRGKSGCQSKAALRSCTHLRFNLVNNYYRRKSCNEIFMQLSIEIVSDIMVCVPGVMEEVLGDQT